MRDGDFTTRAAEALAAAIGDASGRRPDADHHEEIRNRLESVLRQSVDRLRGLADELGIDVPDNRGR